MNVLCSWCYNIFESPGFDDGQESICPGCRNWHQGASEHTIKGILEKLPVPVISLAADNTIISANTKASDVFNLTFEQSSEKKAGEHFNCENSRLPGGCGKTIKCMNCSIRNIILTTYLDGMPRENVSVTIDTVDNKKIRFTFSAVRVKGNVWIRFDEWTIPE